MKKFEEELEQLKNNSHTNFYGYMGIRLLTEPEIIETFKDWVSPEDHQAEIDKRKQQYEEHQEIYSKTAKKLNDAELELSKLKPQLEKQQPDIPEFVGKYIKETADPIHEMCAWAEHYGDNGTKCDDPELSKMLDWFGMNRNMFYEAVIKGYTVTKLKVIVSPCPVCGFEDVENNFCGVCGHKNEYVTADEVEE